MTAETLPPLPEAPTIGVSKFGTIFKGYTTDQMRAYAAAARAQALEEAAEWYVCKRGGMPGTVGRAWAEIEAQEIRSLIDKDKQ